MKYLYSIVCIITFVVLRMIGTKLLSTGSEATRGGTWPAGYRAAAENAIVLPPTTSGLDETSDVAELGRPYSLHYNPAENSWTLYATVLQLKTTSVYGRPGEIAQIEYSLDGQNLRNGWIVLRIDDYSFVDETSGIAAVETGQDLQLFVSGTYVSAEGVDWEKCPEEDIYCGYAGFVEGGFPASEDYDWLTLCPSNRIIHSGFVPGDWINGMLAWKIRAW